MFLHGFMNAYPYYQKDSTATKLCQQAMQIWQNWGRNLQQYLEENQGNEKKFKFEKK